MVNYKTIKFHKGIRYDQGQNQINGRKTFVMAYDRKTNEMIDTVAVYDNKTGKIAYYEENMAVPQEVRSVIELYAAIDV